MDLSPTYRRFPSAQLDQASPANNFRNVQTARELGRHGSTTHPFHTTPISLLAGFRPVDENLFHAVVHLAQRHRVLDLACSFPSNPEKKRVQGFLLDKCKEIRTKLVEQEGYVCLWECRYG